MKRLVILAIAVSVVLSVAGTAFAENGSIIPWGKAKGRVVNVGTGYVQAGNGTINPLENGTIQPFAHIEENGSVIPW